MVLGARRHGDVVRRAQGRVLRQSQGRVFGEHREGLRRVRERYAVDLGRTEARQEPGENEREPGDGHWGSGCVVYSDSVHFLGTGGKWLVDGRS